MFNIGSHDITQQDIVDQEETMRDAAISKHEEEETMYQFTCTVCGKTHLTTNPPNGGEICNVCWEAKEIE